MFFMKKLILIFILIPKLLILAESVLKFLLSNFSVLKPLFHISEILNVMSYQIGRE